MWSKGCSCGHEAWAVVLDCHGANITLATLTLDLETRDWGEHLPCLPSKWLCRVALASMALLTHKSREAVPQPASWLRSYPDLRVLCFPGPFHRDNSHQWGQRDLA